MFKPKKQPGSATPKSGPVPAAKPAPEPIQQQTAASGKAAASEPPAPPPSEPKESAKAAAPRPLSTKRKWLYRLMAMTMMPVLVLVLLEVGLRWAGYGYTTDFYLSERDRFKAEVWVDNTHFAQWIFPAQLEPKPRPIPFVLPKQKAQGVCRVMVLGESAAMGYPDPSMNFARILEAMLRHRYPRTRFEIINASMVAINSHVARQIALQSADKQPDLLIVHLGNNEVVGPFGAAGVLGPFSPSLGFIRTSLAVKSTKVGQFIDSLVKRLAGGSQEPQSWKGMASFVGTRVAVDDARLDRIRAHFRSNLEDICRLGTAQGIPVVVCTIPVNLKDCSPFGSQHGSAFDPARTQEWEQAFQAGVNLAKDNKHEEAIAAFQQAAKLDEQYAELAYRRALSRLAKGDAVQAKKDFELARDLDVLRFRTDAVLNRLIRDAASSLASSGVRLADAEASFAQFSPEGIPGGNLFLEHVHMNFTGNYLLARTVFETLTQSAPAVLGQAELANAPLTEAQCRERLGHTERNEWKLATIVLDMHVKMAPFTFQYDNAAQVQAWRNRASEWKKKFDDGGMERSIAVCRAAVSANGNDWMLRMKLGDLLAEAGRPDEALVEYRRANDLIGHYHAVHHVLGNMEMARKNVVAAMSHYQRAIERDPHYMESYVGLGYLHEILRQPDEAKKVYDDLLRLNPGRAYALDAVGLFHFRQGRITEAKARFQEALQHEPEHVEATIHLAIVHEQLREWDQAIALYEAVLKWQPDMEDVHKQIEKLKQQRDRPAAGGIR